MVNIGDRIRLSSMKGPDREGVVTDVMGSLLKVRWSSQEETTCAPAPGTLTVLAAATVGPGAAAKKKGVAKSSAGAKKPAAAIEPPDKTKKKANKATKATKATKADKRSKS